MIGMRLGPWVLVLVLGVVLLGCGDDSGPVAPRNPSTAGFCPSSMRPACGAESVSLSGGCVPVERIPADRRCRQGSDCEEGYCCEINVVASVCNPVTSFPDAGPADTGVLDASPTDAPSDSGADATRPDATASD